MPFDPEQSRLQDEELKKLAIEAQRHPVKSKQRQIALTKLINKIRKSGRFARPRQREFGERYEEIYGEAIQKLMLYICENIDKYQPERGPVIRWVNIYLIKRFFNQAISEIIGSSDIKQESILDDSNLRQPEKIPLPSEMILDYLENDPEQLCQNLRHSKYPQLNFQTLARERILGKKWKNIAAELGIPLSTLSDFYQTSLKELAPQIRLYLNN
ncbi:hypothetical protein BCD67_09760 [Oscillatoriales cyanobacterium USR001]|nr:hypothetical protein BCD67_09760 [Oscillatoriales cyanobacterium USR001]